MMFKVCCSFQRSVVILIVW